MPNQFFKPTERSPQRLRPAEVVDDGHQVDAPDDGAERIEPVATVTPRAFEHMTQREPTHATRAVDPPEEEYPAEEGVETQDERADEEPPRARRRSPLVPLLAAILVVGAGGYAIYATDAGGIATKAVHLRDQLMGTTGGNAQTTATRPMQPTDTQAATTPRLPAAPQATASAVAPQAPPAALPPPPNAEPMRVARPASPQIDAAASIAEVAQQQQTERMRAMLADTATLARDTANQANRQDARIQDLEQRLASLAARVAAMPATATATAAAALPTDAAATKVLDGYTLTGASQTAARVMTNGREEDVRIGGTHPVLGTILTVRKYAAGPDWRCNYELVTSTGLVRPSPAICKAQ